VKLTDSRLKLHSRQMRGSWVRCFSAASSLGPDGVSFGEATRCFATLVLTSLPLSLAMLVDVALRGSAPSDSSYLYGQLGRGRDHGDGPVAASRYGRHCDDPDVECRHGGPVRWAGGRVRSENVPMGRAADVLWPGLKTLKAAGMHFITTGSRRVALHAIQTKEHVAHPHGYLRNLPQEKINYAKTSVPHFCARRVTVLRAT
jgi:hypothetical protein